MCGRYSLTSRLDQLLPRLAGRLPPGLLEHYAPREQVRPGEPVLALRQEHGQIETALLLWGLIPAWLRQPRGRRPINARSESVAEKASFRGAWRHRRCLLPADGFLEWSGSPRRPWRIRRRDGAPFWLGGLWERWLGADGSELETCVVLTTEPNGLVAPLHERMPVIIPDGLEEAWLASCSGADLAALAPLMQPWDPGEWRADPLPAAAAAENRQLSFFSPPRSS
ncbi:SOS response-associated peptidase [Synechococcus sp. RSCCF101]|uniref:SOS response-associated peptidase n=1 Tax=Synechococcus sp. RSCCF101 TaxID=2511069 RepID=UPI00124944DF|nr:SOS response-associated peptidase [Synechococcus sp. RSCCF101]QEY33419.1 SOS response-associated peptidase [Synechococcus sp. RSCCF101]